MMWYVQLEEIFTSAIFCSTTQRKFLRYTMEILQPNIIANIKPESLVCLKQNMNVETKYLAI